MPKKIPSKETLAEQIAKGAMPLVVPLDYMILDLLPDEGELHMGIYPDARSVDQLRKEKFGSAITPGSLGARMRSLKLMGLVVMVYSPGSTSRGTTYQRTAKGKKLLEGWKKENPSPDTSGG